MYLQNPRSLFFRQGLLLEKSANKMMGARQLSIAPFGPEVKHTIATINPPTGPFTILDPADQGIGKFYVDLECHATDFEAHML